MRRLALTLLGGAALGLSACGGVSSDEAEIRATIEAAAFDADPAGCRRYATQKLLEQTYKEQGEGVFRRCEEDAGEDIPTAVTVTRIEVDGNEAAAQVAYDGDGDYDDVGLVATLALVRRDGRWLEDEVTEFVEFDAEAVVMNWGRQMLRRAPSGVEARASACVIERLDDFDDEQLEALLLNPSYQPVMELARPCEPHSDGF